eukprot:3480671-Amphidinium_carterae.1
MVCSSKVLHEDAAFGVQHGDGLYDFVRQGKVSCVLTVCLRARKRIIPCYLSRSKWLQAAVPTDTCCLRTDPPHLNVKLQNIELCHTLTIEFPTVEELQA